MLVEVLKCDQCGNLLVTSHNEMRSDVTHIAINCVSKKVNHDFCHKFCYNIFMARTNLKCACSITFEHRR